ncbi:hypothetical protein MTO96_036878 [Rhipicephalus appendiculatus]
MRAQDKASALLLKCLSRRGRESLGTLRNILRELGLPWPQKTPASRRDVLDTLVKSSLHFGIHVFWAFFVGRHPSRPNENVIYTTLDERAIEWISTFERLIQLRQHHAYLWRCAEIVGGTGHSYSRMIDAVTAAHSLIAQQVHLNWNPVGRPEFQEVRDPELRRALNGHLADDSQLWPGDKIVNLQPELFDEFNATHFSEANLPENFKLFLGAYVVWLFSPYASSYLTKGMLEDMGLASRHQRYQHHKCTQALRDIVPLVQWKTEHGDHDSRLYTWKLLDLTTLSVRRLEKVYGDAFGAYFSEVVSRVGVNAWNMTLTWELLDSVYSYVPFDGAAGFLDLYIRTLYRLLVAREAVVPNHLRTPPLFDLRHPLAVLVALVATVICKELVVLGRFILYFDENFMHDPTHPIYHQLASLLWDLHTYALTLESNHLVRRYTRREYRELLAASFGGHIANAITTLPEAQSWMAEEKAICNVALPTVAAFRRAFKCEPYHRLMTNFTWPEPPNSTTTTRYAST